MICQKIHLFFHLGYVHASLSPFFYQTFQFFYLFKTASAVIAVTFAVVIPHIITVYQLPVFIRMKVLIWFHTKGFSNGCITVISAFGFCPAWYCAAKICIRFHIGPLSVIDFPVYYAQKKTICYFFARYHLKWYLFSYLIARVRIGLAVLLVFLFFHFNHIHSCTFM